MTYTNAKYKQQPKDKTMKTTTPDQVQKYDVVIYKLDTMEVDTVIGTDMESVNSKGMGGNGRNTAELRRQTGRERINEHYDCAIVDAGKFAKGSTLSDADIRLNY